MSVQSKLPMTVAEFLAWEERQELRYEFDGHSAHAMTGGTSAHDDISANIRSALKQRLSGSRCIPKGPNLKILANGRVRYPDCFVTCTPVRNSATVANNPVVVFEVISEDTARVDRIEKLREYQATPSIQRYVIVEQSSIGATVLTRDGERWVTTTAIEGDVIAMPEIGIEVPLHDFYDGLDYSVPGTA